MTTNEHPYCARHWPKNLSPLPKKPRKKSPVEEFYDALDAGDANAVVALIESGRIDPNNFGTRRPGGVPTTALCEAVDSGNLSIVKSLLDMKGAFAIDVNKPQGRPDGVRETALYKAVTLYRPDRPAIVRAIVSDYRVDPNIGRFDDMNGHIPPLVKACDYDVNIAKVLVEESAGCIDVNAPVTATGRTALHFLSGINTTPEHLELLKYLLTIEEVNVGSVDSNGKTPLHLAVLSVSGATKAPLLLDAGADPLALCNNGLTPLAESYAGIFEILYAHVEKTNTEKTNKMKTEYERKIKMLEEKVRALWDCPEGPGYLMAKSHFETTIGRVRVPPPSPVGVEEYIRRDGVDWMTPVGQTPVPDKLPEDIPRL